MGAMILCSSLCIGAVAIPALVATISYLRNPKAYIALRYLLPAYTLIALNLVVAITVRQILETQQSDSSE